jgi:hypothetical protein
MRDTGTSVHRCAALGDAAPTPWSLGVVGPRVSGLSEAKSACSWVAATDRLLHDMLASIDQNILRPIRVSLKREENLACIPLASSMLPHPLLCFVSASFVLGQHKSAYVVGGGDPSAGGSRHYGGHPCHGGTCCRDFCLAGCCDAGQCCPLCQGCGRPGGSGGEGGIGEGIESGGRESCGVSLYS